MLWKISLIDYKSYFNYLQGRRKLGLAYRWFYLYPKLSKYLIGQTLDLGCGIGDMVRFRPQTKGVDINPETVNWCRLQGLPVYLMDNNRLPFPDKSFESVLLDNVLEHILDPEPVLLEVHRILKDGGRLIIGVPGRKGFASDSDHKIFYDQEKLFSIVGPKGFHLWHFFATPVKSRFLNIHLRQYCIYGIFNKT
jgi:SAM-dependent methyltransferase